LFKFNERTLAAMDIYLLQGGEQTGPFTPEEIRGHLASGALPGDIPAWREGMETWAPINEVLRTLTAELIHPLPRAPKAVSGPDGSISITIPRAKLRWLFYIAGGLFLAFFAFYIGSAYYSVHALKGAIMNGDRDALENHIDFPLLRASIKEEFKAQMARNASKDTGMFSGLAEMMAPTMIDNEVDGYFSPAGLEGILAPVKQGIEAAKHYPATTGVKTDQNPFQPTHVGFDSLTDFEFTFFESKVHMHYYGLGWKVYRIDLVDLIAKGEAVRSVFTTTTDTNNVPATSSSIVDATPQPPPPPPAPKNPVLDQKDGFRSYKLGAPLSQFNQDDLSEGQLITPDPDVRVFFVKTFDPTLGSAQIDNIQLNFKQNLLAVIRVATKGEQSGLGLKESLIAAYGQPNGSITFSDGSKWEGEDCVLEWTKDYEGNATAEFTSKKVDAEIQQMTQDKAKQGASQGAKNL
jgi:hypothetical protein